METRLVWACSFYGFDAEPGSMNLIKTSIKEKLPTSIGHSMEGYIALAFAREICGINDSLSMIL